MIMPMDGVGQGKQPSPRQSLIRRRLVRMEGVHGARVRRKASTNAAHSIPARDLNRFGYRLRSDEKKDKDDDDGDRLSENSESSSFAGVQDSKDRDFEAKKLPPNSKTPPRLLLSSAASSTTLSKSSPSLPLKNSASSTQDMPLVLPMFFPTTAVFIAPIATSLSASTVAQYANNLGSDDYDLKSTTSAALSATLAPKSTVLAQISDTTDIEQPGYSRTKQGRMSSLAQNLLIVGGVIVALSIIAGAVYFILRLHKHRKIKKEGRIGWYGWWKVDDESLFSPSPKYSGLAEYHGASVEDKSIPIQRQLDAFFSPVITPHSIAKSIALSQANSQRQESMKGALTNKAAPFEHNPGPQEPQKSTAEPFYGYRSRSNSEDLSVRLSRQPSDAQGNTMDTQISTQNVMLAQNGANGDDEREAKYTSYLSSLSSGFGDCLMLQEESLAPDATASANAQIFPRQSRNSYLNRLSWSTSLPGNQSSQGDRDTVYTTTSIESAPRFRTVNSWVAHQSSRQDRKRQADQKIPEMPTIPLPLKVHASQRRETVENPIFRFHPGHELVISRGSRVPSEVLDRRLPRS